jgi:hypothetical protein
LNISSLPAYPFQIQENRIAYKFPNALERFFPSYFFVLGPAIPENIRTHTSI